MTLEISLFKLKQKHKHNKLNITDYHTSPLISDYFLITENNITSLFKKRKRKEVSYLDNQFLWHLHREPQKNQGYTQDS